MASPSDADTCSLHSACISGLHSRVQALIDAGADVNEEGEYGQTPLYLASGAGHLDVVKLLMSHGARVNDLGTAGIGPLHQACKSGHLSVLPDDLDQLIPKNV